MPATNKPRAAGSPDAIAAEIEAHCAAERAATAQLDALAAGRPAMLLDLTEGSDDRVIAHDAAMAKARIAVDRAKAYQTKLAADLAAARDAERESARASRHAAALAASRTAEAWLKGEYPKLAARLRDGLVRLAEAKALVAAANEHLPEGGEPVADPEDFRGTPGRPARRTTRKTAVHRDRHGNIVHHPGIRYSDGSTTPPTEVRIEEHDVVEPGEPPNRMPDLGLSVALPALRLVDDPFWPAAAVPHWRDDDADDAA